MKKHSTARLATLVTVAAVGGLLVGGVGGIALGLVNAPSGNQPAAQKQSATVEEPAPKEEAAAEPRMSERGNLIKEIGEAAGIGDADPLDVEFVVTGITIDPECTRDFPQEPENGHFLKLDIDVVTSAEAEGDFAFSFWKWIRPDGTTANADPGQQGNGYSCLTDAEQLPHSIGPSERVSGSIVLDVPDNEGVLITQPSYAGYTGSWLWEYVVHAE